MTRSKKNQRAKPDPQWIFVNSWVEELEPTDRNLTRLGEIFYVTEDLEDLPDAILTKGIQIAHLDRLYFECNDFDRAGDAILERHENYSPDGVPERLRVDNILLRLKTLSSPQALNYKNLMLN